MSLGLKIPTKTLADNFDLQDFKDDFTLLEQFIESWKEFKEHGGNIGGSINVTGNIHSTGTTGKNIQISDNSISVSKNTGEFMSMVFEPVGAGAGILQKFPGSVMNMGTDTNPFNNLYLDGTYKNLNGYTKLHNGILLQVGYSDIIANNNSKSVSGTFTLPITFPKGVGTFQYGVVSVHSINGSIHLNSIGNAQCTVFSDSISINVMRVDESNNWSVGDVIKVCYVAIGY